MKITYTIVKAVADSFPSLEALEEARAAAVAALLQNPDQIISASTGAGAAYTKRLNATPAELVELYEQAVRVRQGLPMLNDTTQVHPVVVSWLIHPHCLESTERAVPLDVPLIDQIYLPESYRRSHANQQIELPRSHMSKTGY